MMESLCSMLIRNKSIWQKYFEIKKFENIIVFALALVLEMYQNFNSLPLFSEIF